MVDFIQLTTVHGDTLAASSGVLVSCGGPVHGDTVPIVACLRGSSLVMTANDERGAAFSLAGRARRTPVLVLDAVPAPDGLVLVDPATRTYVTGRPLDGAANRPLAFMTDEVNAWECFPWSAMAAELVRPAAAARIGAALTLLDGVLDVERLRRFLVAGHRHAAGVLDAALPVLPTRALDEIAARIVADDGLRAELAHAYPEDPWAQTALPALAEWQRAQPAATRRRLRIGPDLDCLGAQGSTGDYASFPHACNARARRATRPHKGPAVLSTARNEGIYLIEWVAYHRLLGAETIVVYSNDNQDGSDVLLAALADAGVITWVDSELSGGSGRAQFKAYGHALGCMPDLLAHRWVLVIDIDEFLVLDRSRFAGLAEFCDWHDRCGADTVAINWQFMAPEAVGDPRDVPLTRRNTRVLSQEQCGEGVRLVKSMSRPNRIAHSEAHVPYADERSRLTTNHAGGQPHSWRFPPEGHSASPKFADHVNTGPAVINHYLLKSAPEFVWKMARNRGDYVVQKGEAPGPMLETEAEGFMRGFLARGLRRDDRAITGMPGLEQEMARLTALPRIGEAVEEIRRHFGLRMIGLRAGYAHAPVTAAWNDEARAFLRLAGCVPGS